MGLMTVFYWFNFHFCKSFIHWSNSIVWILIWTQLASNYKTFAVQTQDKKSNFWIILKNHFLYKLGTKDSADSFRLLNVFLRFQNVFLFFSCANWEPRTRLVHHLGQQALLLPHQGCQEPGLTNKYKKKKKQKKDKAAVS